MRRSERKNDPDMGLMKRHGREVCAVFSIEIPKGRSKQDGLASDLLLWEADQLSREQIAECGECGSDDQCRHHGELYIFLEAYDVLSSIVEGPNRLDAGGDSFWSIETMEMIFLEMLTDAMIESP